MNEQRAPRRDEEDDLEFLENALNDPNLEDEVELPHTNPGGGSGYDDDEDDD